MFVVACLYLPGELIADGCRVALTHSQLLALQEPPLPHEVLIRVLQRHLEVFESANEQSMHELGRYVESVERGLRAKVV